MLRNADISYSSIAPNQRTNSCLCCFCTFDCSHCKSCCRSCFLRLPYGTITSTLLAACGLIISIVSILHSTNIVDRLTHDLIRRKYYWLSDLKVWYIVLTIFVSVILLSIYLLDLPLLEMEMELRKENRVERAAAPQLPLRPASLKAYLSSINILFYFLLFLAFIVFITLFICYVLTDLCNDGTRVILNHNAEAVPE